LGTESRRGSNAGIEKRSNQVTKITTSVKEMVGAKRGGKPVRSPNRQKGQKDGVVTQIVVGLSSLQKNEKSDEITFLGGEIQRT